MPPKLDQLSTDELYEKYGAPELEPVVRLDGKVLPSGVPSHSIFPIWLGEASDKLLLADATILLTDFGEAFSPSQEERFESHTPLVIRPPEAGFEPTRPLSFPSDIWTLACSIWEILGQRSLFEGFLATEDYMIREQGRWSARYDKFHENGNPKNRELLRTWADRFADSVQEPRQKRTMPVIEPEESEAIFSLLRSMLSFRPDDRPTAKQVSESEWMVKWALPEYYRLSCGSNTTEKYNNPTPGKAKLMDSRKSITPLTLYDALKKANKKGRARDRTGIAGIRIQSDDHYTTQPAVVKGASTFGTRKQKEKPYRGNMETNDIEWETEEGIPHADDPFIQQYLRGRSSLILEEQKQRHDFNLSKALPPMAARACKIVSNIRDRELNQVYSPGPGEQIGQFSMGMQRHIGVMSLDWTEVEKTNLWKIMKRMPKGSLLHASLHAAIEADFLIELAFSTPGICVWATRPLISQGDLDEAPFFFQYSSASTNDTEDRPTMWSASYEPSSLIPLSEAASSFPSGGETGFRTRLQSRLLSVACCSDHNSRAMPLINSLLSYEPILRACLCHVFSELVRDGIRYVEFRTTFNFPYRKEGKDTPEDDYSEWCHVFQEELARFQKTDEGRSLYGARIIWTCLRSLPKRDIVENMKNCILAKYDYPDTICGFDIVGDKNEEKPLTDLVPILFWFRKECAAEGLEIPFFFHAGESLKTGGQSDQGLFDAILLGTRRICQGLALCQHPLAIEMVKEKKILIECSPISDEMLGITDSIQTHPLPVLLSRGVPVCLGADALGLFGGRTTGLTRQFWRAIQGLDSMGLTDLAMMVENSIRWSCYQDQPTAEWLSDLREGILGEGTRASRLQEWYADFESFCQWVTVEFAEAEVDEPI
ncbi:hypothetical protein ASPCADRAFT_502804 [Aspergillus carbonarius ITEM 5010]|uniref:adenosine deaminase n=1 Tax=Aspergillus carbonarius (strain ITEM 5010) TaxID=602072 RepID=A0A1R3S1D3_ASPC5|nr:hypothetical protein ASPCADRAFT_502804 [Aspergillus carbonarius ITEM 5010]